MGVHGLWELLSPVGHRVSNEHVRHKVLAVDVSIWLTQFVKAMRDAEGAQVRNAHLLGVLRRCIKLLYLSVRPVLVFDGATPALKRRTLASRRAMRERQEAKLRRLAEKLLVNQMKRSAVRTALAREGGDRKRRKRQKGMEGETDSGGEEGSRRDESDLASAPNAAAVHESVATAAETQPTGEDVSPNGDVDTQDDDKIEPGPARTSSQTAGVDVGVEIAKSHQSTGGGVEDAFYAADLADEEEELTRDRNAGPVALPHNLEELDDDALVDLPPNMQSEVFKQIKLQQRAKHRERMMAQRSDPVAFSMSQIKGFMEHTALNKKIKQARKVINSKTGASQRIASDSQRQYVLEERNVSAAADVANDSSDSDGDYLMSSRNASSRGGDDRTGGSDVLARLREQRDMLRGREETKKEQIREKLREDHEVRSGVGWASKVLEGRGGLSLGGRSVLKPIAKKQEDSSSESLSVEDMPIEEQMPYESKKWEDGDWGKSAHGPVNEEDDDDDDDVEWEDGNENDTAAPDLDDDLFSSELFGKPRSPVTTTEKTDTGSKEQFDGNDEILVRHAAEIAKPSSRSMPPAPSANVQTVDEEDGEASAVKLSTEPPGMLLVSNDGLSEKADLAGVMANGGTQGEDSNTISATIPSSVPGLKSDKSPSLQEDHRSATSRKRVRFGRNEPIPSDKHSVSSRGIAKAEMSTSVVHLVTNPGTDESGMVQQNGNTDQPADEPVVEHANRTAKLVEVTKPVLSRDREQTSTNDRLEHIESSDTGALSRQHVQDHRHPEEDRDLQKALALSLEESNAKNSKTSPGCSRESSIADVVQDAEHPIVDSVVAGDEANLEKSPQADVAEDIVGVQDESRDGDDAEAGREVEGAQAQDLREATEMSHAEMQELRDELELEAQEMSKQQAAQRGAAESVSDEMYAETRDLLKLLGIPYLESPSEAEAQCAFLNEHKVVDGVITEDSDAFLFGAKTVYRRLFSDGRFAEAYVDADIEEQLGLNRERLISLALLLGSDYTPGVRGVGVVNSMEILEAFPGPEGLREFRDWTSRVTLLDPPPDEATLSGTSAAAIRTRFCYKHRNMKRNWEIRAGFPSDAVVDAYRRPSIDTRTERFTWRAVDFKGLARFCWDKFGWEPPRFEQAVGPLRARLNTSNQRRIDEFFRPHRFAKIRSQRLQTAVKGIAGEKAKELMAEGLGGGFKRLAPQVEDEEGEGKVHAPREVADGDDGESEMVAALEKAERERALEHESSRARGSKRAQGPRRRRGRRS